MNNILITGGAGFIGSNLSLELKSKGYKVTVFDNLSKQIHGDIKDSVLYNSIKGKVKFILGDICNREQFEKALRGQDAVIHLASETGTAQSMYEITRYNSVNIIGTANLLDILSKTNHNIKKIIVASSRSIYGEGKYLCDNHGFVYPSKREELNMLSSNFDLNCDICSEKLVLQATSEDSKIDPSSIYGITKQHQEKMILLIGKSLNIPAVSLRFQNVYGPGQSLSNPYTGILSIFSTRILNGNNIDVYEDGNESRDFIFIDDAIQATILALESNEANHQIFNVGSGIPTTVLSVANSLKKLFNSKIKINISGEYRQGDIRHNYADISKIKKLLSFNPKYNFSKGVKKFVKWVNKQNIQEDNYEKSIKELKKKGLIK